MRRLPGLRRRSRSQAASPWAGILATDAAVPPPSGPRVLLATSVGSHPVAPVVDSLVAMALRLRGADPALLLCDGALPACEACSYVEFPDVWDFLRRGPQARLCAPCFGAGADYYAPLPLHVRRYLELVGRADVRRASAAARGFDLATCFSFEDDGVRLGEQARAAVLRFFGKADLSSEPDEVVLAAARRYAAGALVSARVAERLLAELEPDCLVAHHGVYVPQGVLGAVARRHGVRTVHWGPSYRNTTAIFSHGDTYHRTFLTESAELWDRPLAPRQEAALLEYLAERRVGRGDWTWITPEAALRIEHQQRERLVDELRLDRTRPVAGLLTNVLWDAQLYYEGHAFPDMLEWLWATIDHFRVGTDRQLIVRIHPHEVKHGNRQPVADELERRYPRLPETIKIVPHDHPFNTYALMELCDAVLIYGTKTGVELAPFGKPVVTAGDAWVRGKGFTWDVSSRDEYLALLGRFETLEMSAEQVATARRYAYHYFFRRMIPLRSIDPAGGVPPRLAVENLHDLRPGEDPGLDVVCEGILTGRPFVFDAA